MDNNTLQTEDNGRVNIPSDSTTSALLPLKEVKYIQNIGRFEKGQSVSDATFGSCTLVFGENGWGKSTLADLLRSLGTNNPDILIGRKSLGGGTKQKAILKFGTQQALFENGVWTGFNPRIAVYDSVFVNENVFSGDTVSYEHLKNQYGLVVGEKAVHLVRRILELDNMNRENNTNANNDKTELRCIIKAVGLEEITHAEFLDLPVNDDFDAQITAKDTEVKRAARAKELKAASEPQFFSIPTKTEQFRTCLHSKIEQIAEEAVRAVREHITKHEGKGHRSLMAHEGWLEAGSVFTNECECAFCGQPLGDRTLVDSYAKFFSNAYKKLAADVKTRRDTFAQYTNKTFRTSMKEIVTRNSRLYVYWEEAGKFEPPKLDLVENTIIHMENAATLMDAVFQEKQSNLTEVAAGQKLEIAIKAWDEGRKQVVQLNEILQEYVTKIKELKLSIDAAELPKLEMELKTLKAAKQRHHPDTITLIKKLDEFEKRKKDIAKEKSEVKKALSEHERSITEKLGKAINTYLLNLNVGFRIDYKEPEFRGTEPAANYQILIKDVPVSPRSTSKNSLAEPSFRNTLSAGDKSTLALALFLAKINADPALDKTIIVLDDPFTSLDNFRRQFTAIEIRKLCGRAGQTIVLSHDKSFLRLLWDKIDRRTIKGIAIQTGAPGMTTIAPFDIEVATQSRRITEKMKIEEFVQGEQHAPAYIRGRLRPVCEDFYRRGDPSLFNEAASLEAIIRILDDAPNNHPYKGVMDELRDINEYSRGEHHAEREGDPATESSDEELKGYCRKVLEITRGM